MVHRLVGTREWLRSHSCCFKVHNVSNMTAVMAAISLLAGQPPATRRGNGFSVASLLRLPFGTGAAGGKKAGGVHIKAPDMAEMGSKGLVRHALERRKWRWRRLENAQCCVYVCCAHVMFSALQAQCTGKQSNPTLPNFSEHSFIMRLEKTSLQRIAHILHLFCLSSPHAARSE